MPCKPPSPAQLILILRFFSFSSLSRIGLVIRLSFHKSKDVSPCLFPPNFWRQLPSGDLGGPFRVTTDI